MKEKGLFELLAPLSHLIYVVFFFANSQTKLHKILVFFKKTPPILVFCAIQELVAIKADHIIGWTGWYSVVQEEFPCKFMSLTRIENRKNVYRDTYQTKNHKRYASLFYIYYIYKMPEWIARALSLILLLCTNIPDIYMWSSSELICLSSLALEWRSCPYHILKHCI